MKYEEEFKSALESFAQASALDPTWQEPRGQEAVLIKYLQVAPVANTTFLQTIHYSSVYNSIIAISVLLFNSEFYHSLFRLFFSLYLAFTSNLFETSWSDKREEDGGVSSFGGGPAY